GFALENAKLIAANQKANELNKSIFLPQQEDLKQVIIDLSEDSRMIFKAFSGNALNLLNYLGICRQKAQEISDNSKIIKTTAEQVEKHLQRNYKLLEKERENIKSLLESIPNLEKAATDDGMIVQQLNEHKQKIDRILTTNIQLERLLGNIIQNSSNQTQASKEVEQNILLSHHIAKKMSEKSRFLTDLFAQLIAFTRNNTEKIMFWEHLKNFMASFHKLVTSIIKKN
ncbi:MAG: hypothetical protein SWZ49_26440, partial [Cyanobacteriota bacterium]|nr:hypothetical protein [Cyanobacteriota bacterium]